MNYSLLLVVCIHGEEWSYVYTMQPKIAPSSPPLVVAILINANSGYMITFYLLYWLKSIMHSCGKADFYFACIIYIIYQYHQLLTELIFCIYARSKLIHMPMHGIVYTRPQMKVVHAFFLYIYFNWSKLAWIIHACFHQTMSAIVILF